MTTLSPGTTAAPPSTSEAPASEPSRRSRWAKRAGAGVFLFFLIKGLLWLAVPPLLILGARLFAQ